MHLTMYKFILLLLVSSCYCDDADDADLEENVNDRADQLSLLELLRSDDENNQEPKDPQYQALEAGEPNPYYLWAEASLEKYVTEKGISDNYNVTAIEKYSKEPHKDGVLIWVKFKASGEYECDQIKCVSKIFKQDWSLKYISLVISCKPDNDHCGLLRPGSEVDKDPSDPLYIVMAQEALNKYRSENHLKERLEVLRLDRVTEQVVSGLLTRLYINVVPLDRYLLYCYGKFLEKSPTDVEIDVQCTRINHIPAYGAPVEQNPRRPEFLNMASEALQQYTRDNYIINPLEVAKVENVTTAIQTGPVHELTFDASGIYLCDEVKCNAKISWEDPWLDFKKIEVDCNQIYSQCQLDP